MTNLWCTKTIMRLRTVTMLAGIGQLLVFLCGVVNYVLLFRELKWDNNVKFFGDAADLYSRPRDACTFPVRSGGEAKEELGVVMPEDAQSFLGVQGDTQIGAPPLASPDMTRPVFLGVYTIIGIAGGPLAAVGGLVELNEGNIPGGVSTLVASVITFLVSIGLRKGSYAAWVVTQVSIGLAILGSVLLGAIIHPLFLVLAIWPVILLIYFCRPAVRRFCHAVAAEPAAQPASSLASSGPATQSPDREPLAAEVLAPTTPESRPPPGGARSIRDEGPFVCPRCRAEWPTNYCPQCAATIRR